MRHDRTDPGQNAKARPDGWNPELQRGDIRDDAGHGAAELPDRADQEAARAAAGARPDDGRSAGSWQDIKSRFVDDPAGAIAAAEALVRTAVEQRVRALQDEAAAVCARERGEDDASTEALRTRLIRYQEYCQRLAHGSVH